MKGFQVTLLDDELIRKIIEKSYSLTLDASDYLPITFDDRYLTILPTNPVINTISEWSLTLTPPIPLDTGCYIKLYLPNDLTFAYERAEGKGFFQPAEDNSNIEILSYTPDDTLVKDGIEVTYRSVVIEGCQMEEKVGFSPQGSLNIWSISTPIAIKESDSFYVEIYKDETLESMIAKIESGKYISVDQLQPGVVGDIYFKPRDTAV